MSRGQSSNAGRPGPTASPLASGGGRPDPCRLCPSVLLPTLFLWSPFPPRFFCALPRGLMGMGQATTPTPPPTKWHFSQSGLELLNGVGIGQGSEPSLVGFSIETE